MSNKKKICPGNINTLYLGTTTLVPDSYPVPGTQRILPRTSSNMLCIAHVTCSEFFCAILYRHSRVPISKIDFLTELFFFHPMFSCSLLKNSTCTRKSFQQTIGIFVVKWLWILSCSCLHVTMFSDRLFTFSWSPLLSIFLMTNKPPSDLC